ncbi:MAG: glycosyltransferase family 4 protein [Actinomycetota bacterium]
MSPTVDPSTAATARPLRILQVSARFRPYVGGTEIHTAEVSAELARRGHQVTVLTTDLGGDLPADELVDGVPVVRVRAWPRRFDLYVAPGLGRVIGEGSWDLVHVQGYHTAVAPIALREAQRRGIPTALTFHSGGHSSRMRNLGRPIHTRLIARLLRRCDLLIGVSDFEAELFTQRLGLEPGRIRTIPNGVSSRRNPRADDDTAGGPSDRALTDTPDPDDSQDGDGPHLLSIGRLQRYKGHQRIIRAMPRILRAEPRTRLTVIGTGPYQDRLERLVRRLGLGASVSFDSVEAGDRERLDRIMASASAAVFLSEYESHGMAAHEALLAGLPIVVLDATALGRLADDGLARAVPPMATDGEVAAIVLRTLIEAGESGRTGPPADQLERLRHSWSTIAARLEQAYGEVVPADIDERPTVHHRAG